MHRILRNEKFYKNISREFCIKITRKSHLYLTITKKKKRTTICDTIGELLLEKHCKTADNVEQLKKKI